MLTYLNTLFINICTLFYEENQTPKFEKPRGYKNVAAHEPRKLNSQNSQHTYSRS